MVVGAIHVDLVVNADRLPAPGDTVLGSELVSHGGGKGANAALAAARNGAAVTLLGAVGEDEHAAIGLADLATAGVDLTRVQHLSGHRTGTALIVVDPAGQNQIAVAPGAGAVLDGRRIKAAIRDLEPTTGCVLVSTEVSMEAVAAAVGGAAAAGITCVLNCAPPRPEIVELLDCGPILSPNQHELVILDALVSGAAADSAQDEPAQDDPAAAAVRLATRTQAPVIVTLGAAGALVAHPGGETQHVRAPQTDAVDTTGAGDTFNGVLAARLADGTPGAEAVQIAVVAASLSVQHAGARAGMPTAASLADALTAVPLPS